MPLHVDYRPNELDLVEGNQETVNKLESLLSRDDVPHTFLVHGPKGCGKTSIGRIIPNKLGVNENDIYEMNTADYRRLSDARELLRTMKMKPFKGSKRFWLLDEVHQLSKDAQNCLLKALEEPPEHAYICLSTTDPQKLLPTIRDRCHQLKVKPLKRQETIDLIADIAGEEDKDVPEEVIKEIAKKSEGIPRTALVLLDSIIDLNPDDMMSALENSTFKEAETIDLARAIFKGETENKIFGLLESLKDDDPESIRRTVIGYCSSVMVGEANPKDRCKAYYIISAFDTPTYDKGFPQIAQSIYLAINSI